MAEPVVKFNNATGSDTAASGYAATVSLSGTAAATVAANNVVTLTVDAPTLTSVVADDLMWVDSSSGRQFSKIVSADNTAKTVTCADNFANTEGSRNWGIGGKRKTLDNADSRTLFTTTGWKAGWIVEIEDAQSLTSELTISSSGTLATNATEIRGSSNTITITQTAGAIAINHSVASGYLKLKNLKIQNSNATKTNAHGVNAAASNFTFLESCIIGDATNTLNIGVRRSANAPLFTLIDCEVVSCTGDGIDTGAAIQDIIIRGSAIHGNTGHGIDRNIGGGSLYLLDSLVYANGGDGVRLSNNSGNTIERCVIHGNTGDGIDATAGVTSVAMCSIHSNNITANGGYGFNATAASDATKGLFDFNNYGTGALANTSGATNNITAGTNDLTVDPAYTNAAGGNFEAGTSIKAKGWPNATRTLGNNQSATMSFVDIGAQREEPTSSGGIAHIIGG